MGKIYVPATVNKNQKDLVSFNVSYNGTKQIETPKTRFQFLLNQLLNNLHDDPKIDDRIKTALPNRIELMHFNDFGEIEFNYDDLNRLIDMFIKEGVVGSVGMAAAVAAGSLIGLCIAMMVYENIINKSDKIDDAYSDDDDDTDSYPLPPLLVNKLFEMAKRFVTQL